MVVTFNFSTIHFQVLLLLVSRRVIRYSEETCEKCHSYGTFLRCRSFKNEEVWGSIHPASRAIFHLELVGEVWITGTVHSSWGCLGGIKNAWPSTMKKCPIVQQVLLFDSPQTNSWYPETITIKSPWKSIVGSDEIIFLGVNDLFSGAKCC